MSRVLSFSDLEQIAHNLCSLHDFDVEFVAKQEAFAKAVIVEYERLPKADGIDAPAPTNEVAAAVAHLKKRLDQPGAFHLDDEFHLRTILTALRAQPNGGAK